MVYDLYNQLESQAWELECEAAKSALNIARNICILSIALRWRSIMFEYFGVQEGKKNLMPYIIILRFSHRSKLAFTFDNYCT
jgi:hypothetical protein